MRNRLLLTVLLALIVAAVAAPAQAVTKGCDLTGDTRRANDCITHAHVGATADGTMRPGDTIKIRHRIADALRGRPLVVEVQMRRVARDGKKGSWVGLRRTRWSAADTTARASRTVDVCRAGVAGRYEFRTVTNVPRSASSDRSPRQASVQTATSAATTVLLPNRALADGCPNSPDDEMIIEYFNEIEFNEDIYAVIIDQGTSFSMTLSCPPQQGPFPPQNFGMIMALEGAPGGVGCNGGAIVLNKSTAASGGYDACQYADLVCTFDFLVYNKATQVVYSDTIVMITLGRYGNNTYIPNLNPATIQICPANFNPCVLTGTCTQTSSTTGSLTLCDSADGSSCTAPPVPVTYHFNENIYFQTALKSPG
jgi:hypothetical protein